MLTTPNNKRIAKNTALLYFRMLLTIIIGLYTSRVVLNTLGVSDYGVYNIVGGIVAMLAFLNAAMVASSQRFISFELGIGNLEKLKTVSVLLFLYMYYWLELSSSWQKRLVYGLSIPV